MTDAELVVLQTKPEKNKSSETRPMVGIYDCSCLPVHSCLVCNHHDNLSVAHTLSRMQLFLGVCFPYLMRIAMVLSSLYPTYISAKAQK